MLLWFLFLVLDWSLAVIDRRSALLEGQAPKNDEGRAPGPALASYWWVSYQVPPLGQAPLPPVAQVRATVALVLVIVNVLVDFEWPTSV
jgi:hypothetical protein